MNRKMLVEAIGWEKRPGQRGKRWRVCPYSNAQMVAELSRRVEAKKAAAKATL